MKKLFTLIIICFSLSIYHAQAQDDNYDELMDMSIEQLMEIEVYSVSKKSESLFEAPLSSSIITKEDIKNAGITNIPEALRLIPGMIVREISNGNYDVHIRGLDNLNRYTDASTGGNQITLLMIDGRRVFNNNTGGIFWESLPIDIIDVARIEVVRGPAAALYGPNAVSGVINIITKENTKDGFFASAQANQGLNTEFENATTTAGIRTGYKFNEKFDISISGNMQKRERLDEEYYSFFSDEYVIRDSLKSTYALNQGQNLSENQENYAFPNGNQSLDKLGVNLFANYKPNEKIAIGIQSGYQNSTSQRFFRQNSYTPHSAIKMESIYGNLTLDAFGFTGNIAFINGQDDLNSLPFFLPTGDSILLAYTYEDVQGNLEYEWKINEKINVVPGFSYQRFSYSDKILDNDSTKLGLLNGRETKYVLSGSLRAEYKPTQKLRIVGAGRLDSFTNPDDVYFSYELAAGYSLNESNFLRAVVSRSNSGAFMGQTSLNLTETYTLNTPFGPFDGIASFNGNENLELFQLQLYEIGYRSKLMSNLELDVELFYQTSENSNELVDDQIPAEYFSDISLVQSFENIPIEAKQIGATISLKYLPVNNLQIKPFLTIQSTTTEGLPNGYNTVERNSVENIETTTTEKNTQTPTFYGGLFVNYSVNKKLVLNLNSYFMDAHTQFNEYDRTNRFNTAGEIESIFINNINAIYNLSDYISLNLTVRNVLNNTNREFYGSDRKSAVIMAGLQLNL